MIFDAKVESIYLLQCVYQEKCN